MDSWERRFWEIVNDGPPDPDGFGFSLVPVKPKPSNDSGSIEMEFVNV